MTERMRARLVSAKQARAWLANAYAAIKPCLDDGHAFDIDIRPETRSSAQNRRLWACLADVSKQVVWHGQKLTAEEWKTVFTAALKKQTVVPGIEGGFVVMGDSTSKMTKAEMCELQDLIGAFGDQRGVAWSEPVVDYQNAGA